MGAGGGADFDSFLLQLGSVSMRYTIGAEKNRTASRMPATSE